MLRAHRERIKKAGAPGLLYALVILIFAVAFFYHLGSAPAGLNPAELAAKNNSRSLSAIYHNPLYAPHQLVLLALHKLGLSGHFGLRLSSVLFAAAFTLAFYKLARHWFGKTVGLFSAVLLFSTPLFAIAGRQASTQIMLMAPVAVMAIYIWLVRSQKKPALAWFSLLIVAALSLYVPGMIWWLLAAAIINRQKLLAAIEDVPPPLAALALLLFLVLLVPAGLAVASRPDLAKSFAAMPGHWPTALQLAKNLGWMIGSLFVKTPYHSPLIIGRLPILNIIQIALLVFGFYAMWSVARRKSAALILGVVLAVILATINNNFDWLILGVPALAVFIAAGLRYLYIEWRSVFPRNPIPKSVALSLMCLLVIVQLIFGLTYSLVAWPHTNATKQSYVLK